jgi:Protein of unknown function (DUF3551)
MRSLILASSLLAAAFIGGPQAAVAQNEFAFCLQGPASGLNCVYDNLEQCRRAAGSAEAKCVPNPAGREAAKPLPPAGGGEYLPPPTQTDGAR